MQDLVSSHHYLNLCYHAFLFLSYYSMLQTCLNLIAHTDLYIRMLSICVHIRNKCMRDVGTSSFAFIKMSEHMFSPPFSYQVLYKSRCDNRLNEITERASADKREVFFRISNSVLILLFGFLSFLVLKKSAFFYYRQSCLPRNMKRSTSRWQKRPLN